VPKTNETIWNVIMFKTNETIWNVIMFKTNETIWNVIMLKTKQNKYKCHNMDLVHLTTSLPMKFPSTNQYGFSPISKNHLDFVISWITNCEMCGPSLWVHIEFYVFHYLPPNGFID
jgi:hypothetical protein